MPFALMLGRRHEPDDIAPFIVGPAHPYYAVEPLGFLGCPAFNEFFQLRVVELQQFRC
jgi:hypothetical protein